MKKVINTKVATTEVLIDDLRGTEIVAYRAGDEGDSTGICILAYFKSSYGFVNLAYPCASPVFIALTWSESIILASKRRQLYAFHSQPDLIEAIYNKAF